MSSMLQDLVNHSVLILLDLVATFVTADYSFFFWTTFFHLAFRNPRPTGFSCRIQSDPFRKDFRSCYFSGQNSPMASCHNPGALHDLPPFLHHSDPLSPPFLSPLQCFSLMGLPTISEHSNSFWLWSFCTYFFL